MSPDQKPEESSPAPASSEQAAPADALEKTSEELASELPASPTTTEAPKKPSGLKAKLKRFNLYLLLFILIVVIVGAVSVVSFLNSRKTPPAPTVASQTLNSDTLKQLANSDATVGDTGQTLTVQGNAVFSGQVLIRSNLNVAGTIQLGGPLSIPQLTVSGKTNLNDTQANTLQVANATTLQGNVDVQHDLNVGGATSLNGPVTAGQITVTKLILSGNAQLQIPNHVAFTGPSPARSSLNSAMLGAGGGASVNGSDTTGTVNVNTGNGTGTGCFITMTFAKPFAATPHVVITPVGAGGGSTNWYVNRDTKSFSICFNTAPPAGQVFAYDYFITD